ncbi:hypothetical protein DAPPUDRAFT_115031 [Daphnia pulex]|uniref:Paraneoplastic antigen Ma-like C-terminal domain-containing protein n=1 Tax=Daphnia pulex TaxID=6669 RepID=E9HJZ7_DAPPU|nr:hypothetical protein DAPPUDRAFT_115031 [Daphnia pulex]|eukprot:EFX67902.1 hypothetical protein DAPPUDRAFT_115031 [Daphnia pulex]
MQSPLDAKCGFVTDRYQVPFYQQIMASVNWAIQITFIRLSIGSQNTSNIRNIGYGRCLSFKVTLRVERNEFRCTIENYQSDRSAITIVGRRRVQQPVALFFRADRLNAFADDFSFVKVARRRNDGQKEAQRVGAAGGGILARRKVDRVTKGRYVLVHRPKSARIGRTLLGIVANRVECRIKCYFLSCGPPGLQIGTSTITQSGAIGNTQAGADQSIEQIKSASPSQEVLTQNIYPGVRIIDQENEEEFEEINFISSFSFQGTSPAGGQAEPSGQSNTIRESVSPEPEKTIAREQNSSLRRTSPGGQTEPSEQSQRFGVLRSTQSEKTITKEQTLDGIFADFGESRNSTITNKGTEPIESIDYRDRNQKQHRKIPSTPQTSPKRSARIEDFCLLSNTNLITKMNTDTTPKFAAASDLSAFQKDQYVRSSLQSLPSFSGGALQRFDTWLETFEAIMYDSDMTEKDTILELYKKMTDKAHRTMKYILHSGNDKFEAIKEKLLDHFHGDETTEKSLKKFKKANRKPGEKIYDFAIRLKELFRYAYPKNYEEDSFQIILKEKFIDGIDEKLQMKVKYKEFRTFDELVAATRKYSVRMKAIESNKERHEFVNAINQTSHPINSEIQEIKHIVREQHETVNAIASALKQGNKQAEETATDQSEIANCIQELSKAVSFLLTKDGKQQHVQKQVTFQNQMPNFQPTYPNNGNSLRLPYKPFISNNTQPNQPFYNRPSWQPRPPRSRSGNRIKMLFSSQGLDQISKHLLKNPINHPLRPSSLPDFHSFVFRVV